MNQTMYQYKLAPGKRGGDISTVVRQFPNTWAPVVILLKKIISDALPPRVMHIRSNNCSVVYKYCSLGKYCA